jgi:hypothetical protein
MYPPLSVAGRGGAGPGGAGRGHGAGKDVAWRGVAGKDVAGQGGAGTPLYSTVILLLGTDVPDLRAPSRICI